MDYSKQMEDLRRIVIQMVNAICDYDKLRIIYTVIKNL